MSIFTEANASASSFSVLCHGFPAPANAMFAYGPPTGGPVDAKLVGFERARYAHAATDLQLLFCIGMGQKVEEQAEFLLRFVYYETLASLARSLGAAKSAVPEYEQLRKDFKKKHAYGCLAAGMHLAGAAKPGGARPSAGAGGSGSGTPTQIFKRASGKSVFVSKFLGQMGPSGPPQPKPEAQQTVRPGAQQQQQPQGPATRAKILLERALSLK